MNRHVAADVQVSGLYAIGCSLPSYKRLGIPKAHGVFAGLEIVEQPTDGDLGTAPFRRTVVRCDSQGGEGFLHV